jgi:hypothetical protein
MHHSENSTLWAHGSAPGATHRPGRSRNGNSIHANPGGWFKTLRFFEHYAYIPDWDARRLMHNETQTNYINTIMLNSMVNHTKMRQNITLGHMWITQFLHWDTSNIETQVIDSHACRWEDLTGAVLCI